MCDVCPYYYPGRKHPTVRKFTREKKLVSKSAKGVLNNSILGTYSYIISDRNASLYKSEHFDRRVRFRMSGTLLTSFIMAFRSRVIYLRRFILQVQLLQKIQEMKFHSSKMTAVKFSHL
jgi:hypothetical protein